MENHLIYQCMITLLKYTLFNTDTDHRILIESITQDFSPFYKRLALYTLFNRLDIGFILHMIGDTLKARLFPLIFLLILGKIGSQSLFIFCCFIPYKTIADLIQQETVVIFLYQIFHVRILSRQLFSLLLQ